MGGGGEGVWVGGHTPGKMGRGLSSAHLEVRSKLVNQAEGLQEPERRWAKQLGGHAARDATAVFAEKIEIPSKRN